MKRKPEEEFFWLLSPRANLGTQCAVFLGEWVDLGGWLSPSFYWVLLSPSFYWVLLSPSLYCLSKFFLLFHCLWLSPLFLCHGTKVTEPLITHSHILTHICSVPFSPTACQGRSPRQKKAAPETGTLIWKSLCSQRARAIHFVHNNLKCSWNMRPNCKMKQSTLKLFE